MRFDWYEPTISENPVVLVETLKAALAKDGTVTEGRGRHNYSQSFRISDAAGERVADVLCGGSNGDPHVVASGVATDGLVRVVREVWPDHRVSRCDAAEDFQAPTAWADLEALCREVARARKVKGRAIVPDDVADGRTYYLGAPSSDVRVRLYEKTAEVRRHLPEARWPEVPDNWVRLETQVRPRKEWKTVAAKLTPEQVWGFSGWGAELAKLAMALDVERISMYPGRETDDERSFRYMTLQYGPLLRRMLSDLGSWECVGLTIGEALDKQAK